jgi:hypothetical protein
MLLRLKEKGAVLTELRIERQYVKLLLFTSLTCLAFRRINDPAFYDLTLIP